MIPNERDMTEKISPRRKCYDPYRIAGNGEKQEFTECHRRHARDERGESAHDGDKGGHEKSDATVLLIECMRPLQRSPVQPSVIPHEYLVADGVANPVVDGTADNRGAEQ